MIRLVLMMTVLSVLFVGVGYVIGLFFGDPELWALGALVIALLLNAFSYLFSDKIALSMSHAKMVSESEQPTLYRIVSSLAASAGLPTPKIAIINSPAPNAFATGRGPNNSVVAVTTGLMGIVNEDELEAVLSHEISHVKHKDVLIASVAATIAAAISYLALAGRFGAFFGNSKNNNAGILALVVSFLAPLAAMLIQTAISRDREYGADREGAMLSRKPLALASALDKIERAAKSGVKMKVNPTTSPLWIVNPFRGDALLELFSTHPLTSKRINRLKEMAQTTAGMS